MKNEMSVSGIKETKTLKIKYEILKKEGYKLEYGDKTEHYVDVYFSKKVDDVTSISIQITETKVTKRIRGTNYEDKVEALTVKEVLGITEIIKQVC